MGCSQSSTPAESSHGHPHPAPNPIHFDRLTASALDGTTCDNEFAGIYPCKNIDLQGMLEFNAEASDLWGWTDPANNEEYAIVGLSSGTAFVRISITEPPRLVGFLPSETNTSNWRDIKVIDHYALIVSEALGHGLQVVDLSILGGLDQAIELTPDAHYHEFGGAHNIAVNEESKFAYVVGSNTCAGGLHFINLADPLKPEFSGCYSSSGYTHDTQCVTYNGPDTDYLGHELCFSANEDSLSVTDVSNKNNPINIFTMGYAGATYSHQGWLSEDQRHFFLGDELDEVENGTATRTFIWDLMDLDSPVQNYEYTGATSATDHNMYVKGDHIFQANYQAGIRVLRTGNLENGEVQQVAYFDTVPASNSAEFNGAWSVYPYFNSELIVTANISGTLFVLQPKLELAARCDDNLDNDGDGLIDYPNDPGCIDATSQVE